MIALGAEVRAYSVLLLWMSAAMFFLERALIDRQLPSMVYYSLFLYLAILTHYSALWFVIASGIYVLIRIAALTARQRVAWAVFQAGGAAIYVWLYVSHISKLRGSPMEAEAMTGWLRGVYFQHGTSPLTFLRTASVGLFQFLFASNAAGGLALVAFLGAVAWLLLAGIRGKHSRVAAFGLFLLLPFVLDFGASLAGVYPYGGTRHCVYLIFFATAGVSLLIAQAARQRLLPILILIAVMAPFWQRYRRPDPQDMDRESQKKQSMTDAIAYLRASVPTGEPVFADYQASILLEYYLGRDQPPPPAVGCGGLLGMQYGAYRVMVLPQWSATANDLRAGLDRWRSACGGAATNSFWIFDAGWGLNVLNDMQVVAPQSVTDARHFGQITSLFKLRLGP